MKYITFTVPSYNSESYMRRCIESLLAGGEDVEILIIDDGSTDKTGKIADEYEMLYPNIVKAVHKPNGGHGSGVNKGLELARGLYFKVVDSDDWLDKTAYMKLLDKIKYFEAANEKVQIEQAISEEHSTTCGMDDSSFAEKKLPEVTAAKENIFPDLIICNYVYDHLDEGTKKSMNYRNVFPDEKMCDWNTIGHFHPSQYLIMHALMFQTKVLRESGVKLPEHTFYVDNLFSYQPLPYAKNLYYMDMDLYHYYLGREDQSVNEKVLMKRIDQQIRVTELVAKSVDLKEVKKSYPKLAVYMMRNISIMLSISSIHLLLIKTEDAMKKRKIMWEQVKEYDRGLYYRLRCSTLSGLTYLPGRLGGKITVGGYRMARRIYQFQ